MGNTKELPTVISFCSGYAGIERGLDLAGVEHRVLAYVEIESFAIANLVAKMEAGELDQAPIYTNLKTFPSHLFRDCVDLITGGYPCQPFSAAGKRLGTKDPRHLWPYIARSIDVIRPGRVFFENVDGHISMGLREVLSDLEGRGYRQAWGVFSAAEVGAWHGRKRVYIIGDSYHRPDGETAHRTECGWTCKLCEQPVFEGCGCDHGEWECHFCGEYTYPFYYSFAEGCQQCGSPNVSYASSERGRCWDSCGNHAENARELCRSSWHNTSGLGLWDAEPQVGRVANGTPNRVERMQLLGNGVVPQTAARAWELLEKELREK